MGKSLCRPFEAFLSIPSARHLLPALRAVFASPVVLAEFDDVLDSYFLPLDSQLDRAVSWPHAVASCMR